MWNSETEMWELIVRHGLPRFRWLRRSVPLSVADATLDNHPEWPALRAQLAPGDAIWPFRYPRSRRVWGHREGFVVLRRGRFVGGIISVVS